jgi:hypothetical protein
MTINIFKRKIGIIEILLLLFLIWIGTPNFIYDHFKNPNVINDLDNTADIIAIWGLNNGMVPYLDFQWVYGPLMLWLQHLFFKLFGSDYSAIFYPKWVIINVMGIFIAYLMSCVVFNKSYSRIIFVTLSILFVTSNMASLRHLIPEFTLAYAISKIYSKDFRSYFIIGLLFGISLLFSFEYGLASLISYITIFNLYRFELNKLLKSMYVLLGCSAILSIFIYYLYINNALGHFITMYQHMIDNQVLTNPARPEFLPNPFLLSGMNLWSYITGNNFKFYIPFIIYLITLVNIVLNIHKKVKITVEHIFIITFTLYGVGILFRSIVGPAYGFMTYAFIPMLLICTFYIEKNISLLMPAIIYKDIKRLVLRPFLILMGILIWCLFSEDYSKAYSNYNKNNQIQQKDSISYNSAVGFKIPEDFNKSIANISSNIINNSTEADSVFVYPFGAFGFLSGRKQYSLYNKYFSVIYGPEHYAQMIYEDLLKNPPKIVVLNKMTREVGVGSSIVNSTENFIGRFNHDSPLFIGELDLVKRFIIENYQLVFDDTYGAVFKYTKHTPFDSKITNSFSRKNNINIFTLNGNMHQTGETIPLNKNDNNIQFKFQNNFNNAKITISYSYSVSSLSRPLYKVKSRIGLVDTSNQVTWQNQYTDDSFTLNREKILSLEIKNKLKCTFNDCLIIFNFYTNFPNVSPDTVVIKEISVNYN